MFQRHVVRASNGTCSLLLVRFSRVRLFVLLLMPHSNPQDPEREDCEWHRGSQKKPPILRKTDSVRLLRQGA